MISYMSLPTCWAHKRSLNQMSAGRGCSDRVDLGWREPPLLLGRHNLIQCEVPNKCGGPVRRPHMRLLVILLYTSYTVS